MNLSTKAASIASSNGVSPSPDRPGFSMGGIASGVLDAVRVVGIVAAYLAGQYGDDAAGAGSGD